MNHQLRSIRTLVSIAVLAPIVLVSIVLMLLSIYTSNRIEWKLSSSLVDNTNKLVQSRLLDALQNAQWVNELYALRVRKGLLPPAPAARWEQMMYQTVSSQRMLSSVTYSTLEGDAVSVMRRRDRMVLGRALGPGENQTQEFSFNGDGERLPQAIASYTYDARSRLWFELAMKSSTAQWTPVYRWPNPAKDRIVDEIASIAFTRQVTDQAGKVVGVLSIEVSFDAIAEILRQSEVAETGAVVLLDNQDQVLASAGFNGASRSVEKLENINNPDAHVLAETVANAPSADSFQTKAYGRYLGVAPVRPVPGIDWRLATVVPVQVISGETTDLQRNMAIAGILCALVALLLGVSLSRRIANPIQRMANAVRNISASGLDVEIDPQRTAELQQLGTALTDMTRQLKEQVALRAEKEAVERSAEAKSAFFARVTHELRTPLNAIIGYSELLEEQDVVLKDPVAREDLRRIMQASRQLLRLINDLLDLAKAEAGRMPIQWTEVDVSDLVREVEETVRPLVRQNENVMTVENECNAVFQSDYDKLRRILLNLLANSAKFTRGGAITLKVRCDNSHIRFTVADTGVGIDKDRLQEMFEPFTQASITSEGTGLGLTITRQLTHLLGGDIEIDSAPGVGTRVDLYFPVAQATLRSSMRTGAGGAV